MQRRDFLAGAAAASSAPGADKPERLDSSHWGPAFYDEAEQTQITEVAAGRNPFRWYAGKESKVLAFEREFAAFMGTKFALGVTSGTTALQCALAALGVGPGDEVILPAWTWHSCFNTVVLAGALPVTAEIDTTFNIDPDDLERHITPATKVIMAVHLQGTPCRMDKVLEVARRHKLRVLEDCAQSVGASFRGRRLGSLGDVGIYSLQQNKTITAGEGGAVVTNDPVLFERASRFHDMGMLRPPHEAVVGTAADGWFIGGNCRMNEFTGGVLLAQTRKLDRIVKGVRSAARRVYEGVTDLPGLELRMRPDPEGELGTGVFAGFRDKAQRDRFVSLLKESGVPAGGPGGSVVLPLQPHIQAKRTVHPHWPSFQTARGRAIQYGPDSCRKTVDILNRFGGPSIHPKYTTRDTDRVIVAFRSAYKQVM